MHCNVLIGQFVKKVVFIFHYVVRILGSPNYIKCVEEMMDDKQVIIFIYYLLNNGILS